MKKENKKVILWAAIALVVGVLIGVLINATTTGNAKKIISNDISNDFINNSVSVRYHVNCNCYNAEGWRTGCHFNSSSPVGPGAINGFCESCCSADSYVVDTFTVS